MDATVTGYSQEQSSASLGRCGHCACGSRPTEQASAAQQSRKKSTGHRPTSIGELLVPLDRTAAISADCWRGVANSLQVCCGLPGARSVGAATDEHAQCPGSDLQVEL